MILEKKFKCPFCDKGFNRKSWYERHNCDTKKKFTEKNNIQNIRALQLYNYWISLERLSKRNEKTMEQFLDKKNVRIYKLFKRLADFTRDNYVVSAFKYLEWLCAHGVKSRRWTNRLNLDMYREFLRRNEEPAQQVQTSVENIKVWCRENNTPMEKFFSAVNPNQAIALIKQNKILPWVLFGYDRAIEQLVIRLPSETLYTLDDFIQIAYWMEKIKKDPKTTESVQKLCDQAFNEAA